MGERMQKIMITQAILWAAAILLSAIAPGEVKWLLPLVATVGLLNLKRDIEKLVS